MSGFTVQPDLRNKEGVWQSCGMCYGFTGRRPETDRSGAYRAYVPPGTYRLSSVPSPRARPGVAYQQVYRPGVTDERAATVIVVVPGDRLSGQDIRLSPPAETFDVSGTVIDADTGEAVPNLNWTLFRDPREGRAFYGMPVNGAVDSNGEFVIHGLPSGHYWINLSYSGTYYSDRLSFALSEQNVTGLLIKAHKTLTVTGAVIYEGAADAPPPFKLTDLHLFTVGSGFPGPVQADGSFKVSGVTPGKLQLRLLPHNDGYPLQYNNPKGAILLRVELNGAVMPDRSLEVSSGKDLEGVRIIAGYGAVTLHGQIRVEGGTLPRDVLLKVQAYGIPSKAFVGWGQVDVQGRFSIEGLLDGEYDLSLECDGVCTGLCIGYCGGSQREITQHVTISDGKAPLTTIPINLNSVRK